MLALEESEMLAGGRASLEDDEALCLCFLKSPLRRAILMKLQNDEADLSRKIKQLEFKNSLLSDKLDLDYVETLIREKFLFGKEGETLYIIKKNDN